MDGVVETPGSHPTLSSCEGSPISHVTMQGLADQDSGEGQVSAENGASSSDSETSGIGPAAAITKDNTSGEPDEPPIVAADTPALEPDSNPAPADGGSGSNSPTQNETTVETADTELDSSCDPEPIGTETRQDAADDEMTHRGMCVLARSVEEQSEEISNDAAGQEFMDNTSPQQASDLSMRGSDHCRASPLPQQCDMPDGQAGVSTPTDAHMSTEQIYDENREMDLSLSSSQQPQHQHQQHMPEMSPDSCPETTLHHPTMLEESAMKHAEEMQAGGNHLPSHYPPGCHLDEYQHHLQKLAHGHLQDLRADPHRLHEYDEPPQHHLFRDHRHMSDGVGDHVHHNSGRPLDGYWNMPLGLISKVKAEAKEWYGEPDDLLSDSMGVPGSLKDDLYASYRTPPHSNLGGHDVMNGPRPPSMPHVDGLPFSQHPQQPPPDQQQHYQQHYGSHPAMRDLSPMSPGYPTPHNRGGPMAQHHTSQQLSEQAQFGVQQQQHLQQQQQGALHHHPHLQQQQQQYGGQQPYGGQPMGMPSHPNQQIPSPYHQALVGHLGSGGMGGLDGREGRDRSGDPYNFVDEYTGPPSRPVDEILGQQPKRRGRKPKHIKLMENGGDPLAIAAAQAAHEAKKRKWRPVGPDGKVLPIMSRPRKRIDRFDGISEDDLAKKTLPDHLAQNLDIVIISKFPFQIGINPGLFAAYKGHHYAGPGNHFWKCLYLSGLIPEPLSSDDDSQLLEHGIGFTNIVSRTTRGSAELTRKEIKEGGQLLLAKLQRYQPRVAVFNGKGIYEIFSGKKEFTFGRQPEKIEGTHTHVWVMPSSSARCAQLPRALDKVPFYTALRKFRDFLKGTLSELTEEEVTFSTKKHLKLEADKLDLPEMSEAFLDDQLNETCESELDSDEISRSISQSLFNLTGITREQLENMDCPTIPIRKKRGRPKKTPEDPNAPRAPKSRPMPTDLLLCNGEDPPRKKRGRPKKVLEDGTIPVPKRAGRKPKALKEMLAANPGLHGGGPGDHLNADQQMSGMNHMNGMMPPTGYQSAAGGPFSPHFAGGGGVAVPNGPLQSMGQSSHPGMMNSLQHGNNHAMPPHSGNMPGASPMSGLLQPSSNGPLTPLSSVPQRVNTPKPYGQSPGGYSPVPRSHSQLSQPYSQSAAEKGDIPSVDDHDLGLSPPPVSPVMAQPDFEPPTSLPESECVMPSDLSTRAHNNDDMGIIDRRQQNQFSNPSTPADQETVTYKNYSSYATTAKMVASPSGYAQTVAHSPSYPASVSVSPSYGTTSNNTRSPCPHQIPQSPSSYSQNIVANNSPSFATAAASVVAQSPSSYPPLASNHSPTTSSSSYHPTLSQSPSCGSSSITRSPSYPASLTHSPSYPPNVTHSPSASVAAASYRPQLPQSPQQQSFSPANKPNLPLVAHSPHVVKGDVSSKSISGLESLVDQIPSLNDPDSVSSLQHHVTSVTPGPPAGLNAPFSPPLGAGGGAVSSYQAFTGGVTGGPPYTPVAHYHSPSQQQQLQQHPYSPHFSSSSGGNNLSTNFSVSSLANSSITTSLSYSVGGGGVGGAGGAGYEGESSSSTTSSGNINATVVSTNSNSFSVSSLTGDSPCSTPYNNNYSPLPVAAASHNYSELMSSSILPPTPPMGVSFMGGGTGGVPNNAAIHSSMNMAASGQLPYPYPQYGESPSGYPGHGPTFPYSPTGAGFHLPSRFPYPSPYGGGGPYAQGYSQSAVLERIKQTGMGFGGF